MIVRKVLNGMQILLSKYNKEEDRMTVEKSYERTTSGAKKLLSSNFFFFYILKIKKKLYTWTCCPNVTLSVTQHKTTSILFMNPLLWSFWTTTTELKPTNESFSRDEIWILEPHFSIMMYSYGMNFTKEKTITLVIFSNASYATVDRSSWIISFKMVVFCWNELIPKKRHV
jgi:hypothetical protein